jgi:hypothetical protein
LAGSESQVSLALAERKLSGIQEYFPRIFDDALMEV